MPMPPLRRFLLAVLPVVGRGVLGSLATHAEHPDLVCGPRRSPASRRRTGLSRRVWTILYAMMAYALWRISRCPRAGPAARRAVAAFFVQLALNALWSWAFFGAHSPLAGLVVILALIVAILATIRAFWPLDRMAGLSARALSRLGRLRDGAQRGDLAAQG